MKRIISKIKSRLKNSGSSLVLVIVAMGFIGILTGSLLTAVGYVYRQKLYDYNARSNFHYLEQAMDEIYSGIGSKTMENLQIAYEKTREEAIEFNVETKSYETLDEEVVNNKFKDNFMALAADGDYYKVVPETDTNFENTIVYDIKNMITNSSVKLVTDDLKIFFIYVGSDGSYIPLQQKSDTFADSALAKIVLKNVKLEREAEYKRSSASGTFKQTIQTDIEIARPDFNVNFGVNATNMSKLFEYCMIADSGIDFDRVTDQVLTINGNIYAANDFYNKDYNKYPTQKLSANEFHRIINGKDVAYNINPVSRYTYDDSTDELFNHGYPASYGRLDYENFKYDGYNDRSKYSGFYIDGGTVNLLADTVIVPGSISVMNGGKLSVYGVSGDGVEKTDVWADEIVLGGYSLPRPNDKKEGASAIFNANLYIKDDTQIEADYAKFKLNGGYYGFSNSTSDDGRSYLPTVKKYNDTDKANIYQELVPDTNADGTIKRNTAGEIIYKDDPVNRGHYNSSSILINGQHASLDLSGTKTIFLAGRAYIELSNVKTKTETKENGADADKGMKTDPYNVDVTDNTYEYKEKLDDYRTGESISTKSNQLAYYPSKASGALNSDNTYFELSTGSKLYAMPLFDKYFDDGRIPIIYQKVEVGTGDNKKTKTYYYFDFEQVVRDRSFDTTKFTDIPVVTDLTTDVSDYADELEQRFIKDYFDYFNFCVNKDSDYKLDYMGYEPDYDSASKIGRVAKTTDEFRNLYSSNNSSDGNNVDMDILEQYPEEARTNVNEMAKVREKIQERVNELQNVTNYSDFVTGRISVAEKTKSAQIATTPETQRVLINTSGAITSTDNTAITSALSVKENVELSVDVDNSSIINSNLYGASKDAVNTNNTNLAANTLLFAKDYNKHYQYYKYTLGDVYTGSEDATFLETMISENGDGGITPINYYMNYDLITNTTNINPTNFDLGEYKVYASGADKLEIDGSTAPNGEITGIVIAKGDVYFENVSRFNGLVMTGGKIFINKECDISSINSSILCKNIINECISKASYYEAADDPNQTFADGSVQSDARKAIQFLELFKAYKDIAEQAKEGGLKSSEDTRDITNIDYSDLVRYNNWLKDVE